MHTQRHPHIQTYWQYKAKYTQLKTGSKHLGNLQWIKTSACNRKHGRSNILGNVYRLDLSESKEGFCQRGRGRSFHVDGLKTEKAQEPTVESVLLLLVLTKNDLKYISIFTGHFCLKWPTIKLHLFRKEPLVQKILQKQSYFDYRSPHFLHLTCYPISKFIWDEAPKISSLFLVQKISRQILLMMHHHHSY